MLRRHVWRHAWRAVATLIEKPATTTRCLLSERCPPPPASRAGARLALVGWPGADACDQRTWARDCGGELTVTGAGAAFRLEPSGASSREPAGPASLERGCAPARGVVVSRSGARAAVALPGYPVGVAAPGADGTVEFDFGGQGGGAGLADWSRCVLTYRVVEGSFLGARAPRHQAERR
jgi:hypothetical protein